MVFCVKFWWLMICTNTGNSRKGFFLLEDILDQHLAGYYSECHRFIPC